MAGNIATADPPVNLPAETLADHAAAIRRLGQRIITDIIEIGRHLTEAKDLAGHGHFGAWLLAEFGWSDRTARRFMSVYAMSLKSDTVSDLKALPMRELYLLAAPSTPEEARTEIFERAAAGEPVSGADVRDAISRAKGGNGTAEAVVAPDLVIPDFLRRPLPAAATSAEAAANTETETDVVAASAEARKALYEEPQPEPETLIAHWHRATSAERATLLNAIGVDLPVLANAEIVKLAVECSVCLAEGELNIVPIREKLKRIEVLAGSDATAKSNVKLDRGAFALGMGLAGQSGKKFLTL
jgi:Protein of unknown function (DUF3102)